MKTLVAAAAGCGRIAAVRAKRPRAIVRTVITQPLVDRCIDFFVTLSAAILFFALAEAQGLRFGNEEGFEFCMVC